MDLDFSADDLGAWDSDTSHLDEITEKVIEEKINPATGLKPSETLSEEEFFINFFCQNLAFAEMVMGMVGLSVKWQDGVPEPGARATSNLLYRQCEKFRFLAWAIKRGNELQDMFAMGMFLKSKADVVALHFAIRKAEKEKAKKQPANDNSEPLEESA